MKDSITVDLYKDIESRKDAVSKQRSDGYLPWVVGERVWGVTKSWSQAPDASSCPVAWLHHKDRYSVWLKEDFNDIIAVETLVVMFHDEDLYTTYLSAMDMIVRGPWFSRPFKITRPNLYRILASLLPVSHALSRGVYEERSMPPPTTKQWIWDSLLPYNLLINGEIDDLLSRNKDGYFNHTQSVYCDFRTRNSGPAADILMEYGEDTCHAK